MQKPKSASPEGTFQEELRFPISAGRLNGDIENYAPAKCDYKRWPGRSLRNRRAKRHLIFFFFPFLRVSQHEKSLRKFPLPHFTKRFFCRGAKPRTTAACVTQLARVARVPSDRPRRVSLCPGEAEPPCVLLWEDPGTTFWPGRILCLIRADSIFSGPAREPLMNYIMAAVFPCSAPSLSPMGLVESVNFFGARRVAVLFQHRHRISILKAVAEHGLKARIFL